MILKSFGYEQFFSDQRVAYRATSSPATLRTAKTREANVGIRFAAFATSSIFYFGVRHREDVPRECFERLKIIRSFLAETAG
jgi:hypothetical protein